MSLAKETYVSRKRDLCPSRRFTDVYEDQRNLSTTKGTFVVLRALLQKRPIICEERPMSRASVPQKLVYCKWGLYEDKRDHNIERYTDGPIVVYRALLQKRPVIYEERPMSNGSHMLTNETSR